MIFYFLKEYPLLVMPFLIQLLLILKYKENKSNKSQNLYISSLILANIISLFFYLWLFIYSFSLSDLVDIFTNVFVAYLLGITSLILTIYSIFLIKKNIKRNLKD